MKRLFLALWLAAPVPGEPLLKPGDGLEVRLRALPEAQSVYWVDPYGWIEHPVAGRLRAAGMSLEQFKKVLGSRFRVSLKDPRFEVSLCPAGEVSAEVVGEVRSQGRFALTEGATFRDLLERAGGLTFSADEPQLLRAGRKRDVGWDEPVCRGDVLVVGRGRRIYVAGEVENPGSYTVPRKSSDALADALRLAGGTKATAALPRISIARGSKTLPGGVELLDGDVLYVPVRGCAVLGQVAKQGRVALLGGETLFDVVSASDPGGAEVRVTLFRADDGVRDSFDWHDPRVRSTHVEDGDIVLVGELKEPLIQNSLVSNPRYLGKPYTGLLGGEPYWDFHRAVFAI